MRQRSHRVGPASLMLTLLALAPARLQAQPSTQPLVPAPPAVQLRPQTVAPLPGGLDAVLLINDNNPELITGPGVLLSTFAGQGRGVPEAHLDVPLNGRFDLFSHHVYAGQPDRVDSTLWLALVAQPRGSDPITLNLLAGSTALSQSLDAIQPGAPFLPLPSLLPLNGTPLFSGPGSRVSYELLTQRRSPLFPAQWTLEPGTLNVLAVLPLPVRGLDPLLNGRNLQLRLKSDGPMDLAMLAAFGTGDQPPPTTVWSQLLQGDLSSKEHKASARGAPGPMIYSRVSGVQVGRLWSGRITDPGQPYLSASRAPISWPIAALERGTLGTNQVQTAPLRAQYPGTAWAAHGNYGVEYDLTLPLRNTDRQPVTLQLALESPLKGDQSIGGLRFNTTTAKAVMFRGTVEVSGLDGEGRRPALRQAFHLVLRNGQPGPPLGRITLAPGQERQLRVRLVYPADATPPQVLSLLPLPPAQPSEPPVKQSPTPAAAP